jgi:hypothetical protein
MAEHRFITSGIDPWMANNIWHVLVTEGGARDGRDDHYAFVAYLEKPLSFGHEWRFQGALGFGGKFYNDGFQWRVGCYREDDTQPRLGMIQRTNERLAALREVYLGGDDA